MTKADAGRLGGLKNKGEANPAAKLTREVVERIRNLRALGVRRVEVAAMFGIHPAHVTKLVRRERWA